MTIRPLSMALLALSVGAGCKALKREPPFDAGPTTRQPVGATGVTIALPLGYRVEDGSRPHTWTVIGPGGTAAKVEKGQPAEGDELTKFDCDKGQKSDMLAPFPGKGILVRCHGPSLGVSVDGGAGSSFKVLALFPTKNPPTAKENSLRCFHEAIDEQEANLAAAICRSLQR